MEKGTQKIWNKKSFRKKINADICGKLGRRNSEHSFISQLLPNIQYLCKVEAF